MRQRQRNVWKRRAECRRCFGEDRTYRAAKGLAPRRRGGVPPRKEVWEVDLVPASDGVITGHCVTARFVTFSWSNSSSCRGTVQ
jgi:hypothetical protein